jgi:RNA polymerase sigma-32 factor
MITTSESTTFGTYRAEVSRRARLTPEVEQDLALRCRNGDREAGRRLIEGCLSHVIAIALEYRLCGIPMEDLVQQGNLGLLKAVERFDPTRGTRLGAYAAYWIRSEIREYVERHYRIVRLGSSKEERRAMWLYRRTREDRPEALAAMSGLSTERATELLPLLRSLDVSLTPPGDGAPSVADHIADGAGSAEDALGDAEVRDLLRTTLDGMRPELSARDLDIVQRRLLADEPATLEQIGDSWGVSKERVRQVEEKVMTRMRTRFRQLADAVR